MRNYNVVFIARVNVKRRVILYKDYVYKSYGSRDEATGTWALYPPRWKRTYGSTMSTSRNRHKKENNCLGYGSHALLLSFIIVIIGLFVYVIRKLVWPNLLCNHKLSLLRKYKTIEIIVVILLGVIIDSIKLIHDFVESHLLECI